MATGTKVSLDKVTGMIPICTGERDVHQFIRACELACSMVDKEDITILTKFINTKLFDRALEVCRYRDVSKWEGIKLILLDAFESQRTASSLQVALNSEQTLVVFLKGLIPNLRTIVKSRNPPTLEAALQLAKEEETELTSDYDAYQYYGNNNTNKSGNNQYNAMNNRNGQNSNRSFNNNGSSNWNNNNYPRHYNRGGGNSNFNNRNKPHYDQRPNFNRMNTNRNNNDNPFPPRNNNNFNRNNYPNNNAPINIRCYQCGGNHYARDCVPYRGNNNNMRSTHNRNNYVRQPTSYNTPGITKCTYCNVMGRHEESRCYKKQNSERSNNRSGNLKRSNDLSGARPINLIATMGEDQDDAYISYTLVQENKKILLKGINDKIVSTIGLVKIILKFNGVNIETEFQVANEAIIYVANNSLTINDKIVEKVIKENLCFNLKPRTETVVTVAIADPAMENKNIIIFKQELIKDVYCANVVGTVKLGKVIVSILNVSEVSKEINEGIMNQLLYDTATNYNIHAIHAEIDNENRVNRILNLIRNDHMSIEERKSIFEICEQYAEIFHLERDQLTFTDATEHLEKKIDASGKEKFHIIIDFRALNQILDHLGQCQLFSVIDLASGFYQIPLSKSSRELTAFSANNAHYHFKRMAMGMKTSPSTFQRLMDNVLSGIIGIKCLVYLDDIIIYGNNLIDHNNKLIDVFGRFRAHNLKIQPDKCEFVKRECIYLGHVISETGIRSDPKKIQAVLDYPEPMNVKKNKSFLGLSGYYRKFIENYSEKAKPITNLLKKDVAFNWSEECDKAFGKLKHALCTEPGEIGKDLPIAYASRTLSPSESNYSTTELECLAIVHGIKQFRPYLYGRKFTILSDHRPLAWLFNLKDPLSKLARWRIQLEQYDYVIKHKPGAQNGNVDALSRMYTINEIKNDSYNKFLEKFETTLIANSNVKEVNGELLESPNEYHIVTEIEKYYNFRTGINYEIRQKYGDHIILKFNKNIGEITKVYNDRFIIFLKTKGKLKQLTTYENLYTSLLNLKYFSEKHSLNKLIMNQLGRKDGLEWTKVRAMIRYIFRNTKIEILICSKLENTKEEKSIIFKQFHDSILGGHAGVEKTIKKIKRQFNWPGLKVDVKNYIKNCESCQKNKITNKKIKQPMVITSTSSKPFEKIFLDIVGPLVTTVSGNNYILTMQDDLTKYSLGVPLPNHTGNTVAEAFVVNFICSHGIPETILTDQGTDFLSKTFAEVCKLLKINKIKTSPYHPQTNGNKDLNTWDQLIPYALFVYNSIEHTSTGYQPYALLYGKELIIPVNLKSNPEPRYNYDDYLYDLKQKMQESHKIAKERLIKKKLKSKSNYDKNAHSEELHVKDSILLKDNTQKNKLNSLWKGPYEVLEILDTENIIIQRGRNKVTVHKNDVKRMPPVGKATIIYREEVPPTLTGEEGLEELKAGRELAFRVSREFAEANPAINRRAWDHYAIKCIMRGRGICMRRAREDRGINNTNE
ncbi:hypothetical protein QTP88_021246 [Uroleucon formosanum]